MSLIDDMMKEASDNPLMIKYSVELASKIAEIDRLKKENNQLKECVQWYAVCDDVGVKARKTLKELKE